MITLADFDTYPDFPVPGILFYDISPILASPRKFREACDALKPVAGTQVDIVAGVDARGFIFAPVVAQDLGVGMTMIRKKGKMPGELLEADATIEYGASELVMNPSGIDGKHVLVVDDVLATGGTATAVAKMLLTAGAASVRFSFLMEIEALPGRDVLANYDVKSVVLV
ncbi:adenine phosphoribosyltransferase [Demequina aurantiaca]|uniref:adenine phosphoribosyltransferase n=1 Tax=Demequina aurantiaca TaxID=676200 RepID=UPI001364BD8E|nr:adenine phosphoribosyltransferase [Demequina aurantiaca]